MKRQWTTLKQIVRYDRTKPFYLSLIDEDGHIICVNAKMQKEFDLENPRLIQSCFFEMIHPEQVEEFKNTVQKSLQTGRPQSIELYIRNGYYHPMKWDISPVKDESEKVNTLLCVGEKLMDDQRLLQFNRLGEKNYQLIIEGLETGVFFTDKKGELIAANKKAAAIFNVTLERLYQLQNIKILWNTSWKITSEKGDPVVFDDTPFMKALQTGKSQEQTLIIRIQNGSERWIRFNSQPLLDDTASVPATVVTNIVDITAEKKLKVELEELDTTLRAFMHTTPNLAWVADEEEHLIFASQSFYSYFGLEEKKSVREKLIHLLPGRIAAAFIEKHSTVLQTGRPIEYERRVKLIDDSEVVFYVNISPLPLGGG
jgi:PAS domain S-box-containing protein